MTTLRSEFIASPEAPVVVLFGGNPYRREEVIAMVESIGGISVYGALNLQDGLALLQKLTNVRLVVIGGRYSEEQRLHIRTFIASTGKDIRITEPGYAYPYEEKLIETEIRKLKDR